MLYATPLTFLSLRRSAVALRSAVGSSLGARVKTAQKARTAAVRTRSSTSSRRSWSMAEGARREGGGDADFILRPDKTQTVTGTEDHRLACSTIGWVILLGGIAISWKSCKQSSPSDSVCEAEYRSALDAAKEVVWLRFLLEELGDPQPAVPLYIDNDACQKLVEGESIRGETRHLVLQYLILRSVVKEGEVEPRHVSGRERAADSLTNVVPPRPFLNCKRLCGMVRMQSASQTNERSEQQETSVWL